MSRTVIPVLMSGGRGTRLWPLSRRGLPKQLQTVLGNVTLLQSTIGRMTGLDDLADPIVVCSAEHVDEIGGQLSAVGFRAAVTVAEPVGRNTAPAVAAAALVAPSNSILVVLPADHVVVDEGAFREAMKVAIAAADTGDLVTFGVVADRPETGYGYIEAPGDGEVRRIVEFVEKPDPVTAARYVEAGTHFWNSGMFVFRTDVVLDEMRRYVPGLVDAVRRSMVRPVDRVVHPGREFESALSIPFDVAVMERTDRAVMVPLDAGWSDVGSWRSLWEVSPRDRDENVTVGRVITEGSRRSYLRAETRPLVVLGLEDVVVVDTGDVVFVSSMEQAQDVRRLVTRLDGEHPELT